MLTLYLYLEFSLHSGRSSPGEEQVPLETGLGVLITHSSLLQPTTIGMAAQETGQELPSFESELHFFLFQEAPH